MRATWGCESAAEKSRPTLCRRMSSRVREKASVNAASRRGLVSALVSVQHAVDNHSTKILERPRTRWQGDHGKTYQVPRMKYRRLSAREHKKHAAHEIHARLTERLERRRWKDIQVIKWTSLSLRWLWCTRSGDVRKTSLRSNSRKLHQGKMGR